MTKSKIYLVKFSRCYAKKAATPTTQTPFDASAFDLRMQTSITKLKSDLDTFRMGRANPAILARVRVTVGSKTALLPQLAQINIKDPHTLHVVVADQQVSCLNAAAACR